MSQDDFVNTGTLDNAIRKLKNSIEDETVSWLKIQWFGYQKEKSFFPLCTNKPPSASLNVKFIKEGRPIS